MTHVIQSVLTTLCAAEWVSVTAARVLIGTFWGPGSISAEIYSKGAIFGCLGVRNQPRTA
jgi:hypothetical protein